MKTVNSNLKTIKNNNLMWEDEELVENHNPRINGKKLDKKRPVQNWKKVWAEHVEDYDEVDEFFGR